jgi:hypothetical protein
MSNNERPTQTAPIFRDDPLFMSRRVTASYRAAEHRANARPVSPETAADHKQRRQLVRDAMTDARAGMIRLEAHDYEPAAVLLRMALDQLEEAGMLKNV